MSSKQKTTTGRTSGSPAEFFQNFVIAWKLMRDGRVNPLLRFGIPLLALIYVLFPIDVIPDIIPGLGQIDDIGVILLALQMLVQFVSPDIVDGYRSDARPSRDDAATGQSKDDDVVDADYRVVE
ncbi:MAG: DUF1232 domain-containing protein [Chloroflexi bacterium]|nr:DUF1232 domain-containing protein [Chloroflexota bacterium]